MIAKCAFCGETHEVGDDPVFKICPEVDEDVIIGFNRNTPPIVYDVERDWVTGHLILAETNDD